MSNNEEIHERLQNLIFFAANPEVYLVVDSSRYQSLPERLRNSKEDTDLNLIQMLGLGLASASSTAYVFNDPEVLEHGGQALKEVDAFKDLSFYPFKTSAAVLLVSAKKYGCDEMVVDFATEFELRLPKDQIAQSDKLVTAASIARRGVVYLAETDGQAISLDLDDKRYAVGFLDKQASRQTLEGLKMEYPNARMASNKTTELASNFLKSDYDGIIFNPATGTQAIVAREEMELLSLASELIGEKSIAGKLKSVFKRK